MPSQLRVLLAVLLLALAACGGGEAEPEPEESPAAEATSEAAELSQDVIRVSVGIDGAYAPMFLADEQGLFEEAGLNVEVVQFAQGGEGVDALIAGEIQMSGTGEATAMGKSTRSGLAALAVFQESGEYIKLVGREGIGGVEDIQTMGVVPGSLSEYGASRALAENGVDEGSVEFVQAGPPELPALLQTGEIDGFVLWEPWPTRAEESGGQVLAESGDFGYVYNQWLVVDPAWLEENEAEARALVEAIARACEMVESDPEAAVAATLAQTDVPEETVQLAVDQIDFGVRDFTDEDLETYTDIAEFLVEREIVETDPNLDQLLRRGFVES
jgi:NitT/TauT family transport system substrate-binding protein